MWAWLKPKHLLGPWEVGPGWFVGLEWKFQDLWVGAYWRREGTYADLWVCLVPMLPIRVRWRAEL